MTSDVTARRIDMGGVSSSAGTTATPIPPAVELHPELSQKKFTNSADGDDSFYNDTNLGWFDSSTALVDTLGFDHPRCDQPRRSRKARDG